MASHLKSKRIVESDINTKRSTTDGVTSSQDAVTDDTATVMAATGDAISSSAAAGGLAAAATDEETAVVSGKLECLELVQGSSPDLSGSQASPKLRDTIAEGGTTSRMTSTTTTIIEEQASAAETGQPVAAADCSLDDLLHRLFFSKGNVLLSEGIIFSEDLR